MARLLRLDLPGIPQHLVQRRKNLLPCFLDDGHGLRCLTLLGVGHCGDNAAAEGFFGLLKRERVNRRPYQTRTDARSDLFDYIQPFHNPRMQRRVNSRDQKFIALTQLFAQTG